MNTFINSEVQEKFLDKKFAIKQGLAMTQLMKPIIANNIDGTENVTATSNQKWLAMSSQKKQENNKRDCY